MPQPEGWEKTLDSATGWRKNIALEDEPTQYFQNGSIFRKKTHDRTHALLEELDLQTQNWFFVTLPWRTPDSSFFHISNCIPGIFGRVDNITTKIENIQERIISYNTDLTISTNG